jgi:hypothetical protein
MKYNFKVAGKPFSIDVTDRDEGEEVTAGHPSYYFSKALKQTEIYLDCVYALLEKIAPLRGSVVELCGGLGIFPTILWDLLKPTKWTAYDWDSWCEANYQSKKAQFQLRDVTTLTAKELKAKLVLFDAESNTLSKLINGHELYSPVVGNIVAAKPTYMEITDVGSYWCHLPNHHPIYRRYFNRVPTKDSYHEFMALYYRKEYGRELIAHTRGGGAGYYLFK